MILEFQDTINISTDKYKSRLKKQSNFKEVIKQLNKLKDLNDLFERVFFDDTIHLGLFKCDCKKIR